jgi:hypothetical protein
VDADGDLDGPTLGEPDGGPDGDGDAAGELEGDPLGDGDADGDGEGDADGDATLGLGATDGAGVGWTGPGTKATIAPTRITAVTTPASSPRTMARRGGIAGGYQYQAPEAARLGTG